MGRDAFHPRPHSFLDGGESIPTGFRVFGVFRGCLILAPLAPLCGHPLRWRVSAFVFVSTFVCFVYFVVTPGDRGQ